MPFNEAIELTVAPAGSGMFETIFIYECVPTLRAKGLSIVCEGFQGIPLRENSSVRWLMAAPVVAEDIWNSKVY